MVSVHAVGMNEVESYVVVETMSDSVGKMKLALTAVAGELHGADLLSCSEN